MSLLNTIYQKFHKLAKPENHYLTKMNKQKKAEQLQQFKVVTIRLLANKVFCVYMNLNEQFHVEPEHFVEDWIGRNVLRPDEQLKKWIWRYFMENLVEFRRFQKSR